MELRSLRQFSLGHRRANLAPKPTTCFGPANDSYDFATAPCELCGRNDYKVYLLFAREQNERTIGWAPLLFFTFHLLNYPQEF